MTEIARIMIVEDEGLIAHYLESVLTRAGYQVIATAASSEEALSKMQLRPHLLLMDINIRGSMDGIDTTSKLRETSDIPVIYLTGQADSHTLDRAKKTAAFGVVKKPFKEKLLLALIEAALQHRPSP